MKKDNKKKEREKYTLVNYIQIIMSPSKTSKDGYDIGYLVTVVSLLAFIVTLILSFMNSAFVPSCMLMLSLHLFTVCYRLKDDGTKKLIYTLYIIGILLIVCSLVYTFTRIY